METLAKVAIGAVVLGGGLWLMSGTSNAAPAKSTAAAAGTSDGCTAGTADGKAGRANSRPAIASNTTTVSDPTVNSAAQASGSPADYLQAYADGYDNCYNMYYAPPAPSGGPKPTPIKPPPGVPAGTTHLNKETLGNDYSAGCQAGAHAGYVDGFNNSGKSYDNSGSVARVAAYKQAYDSAFSLGQSDMFAGKDAPSDMGGSGMDTVGIRVLGVSAGCAGGFDEWLGLYVGAHPGIVVSGRMVQTGYTWGAKGPARRTVRTGYTWGRGGTAPGRTNYRGPVMGRVAARGWPAPAGKSHVYSPSRM